MAEKRKIVEVKKDDNGVIIAGRLAGNTRFTGKEKLVKMADNEQIDAVAVHPQEKEDHVRNRPDKNTNNNLGNL